MKKKQTDKQIESTIKLATKEIILILEKHEIGLSTACAILGGIFAALAAQSTDHSSYLSFLQSFGNTMNIITGERLNKEKNKDSE